MIIPVRCFGCGKVLADKWDAYVRLVQADVDKQEVEAGGSGGNGNSDTAVPGTAGRKTAQGRALDALGIHRLCCRTPMLTHVDLSDII